MSLFEDDNRSARRSVQSSVGIPRSSPGNGLRVEHSTFTTSSYNVGLLPGPVSFATCVSASKMGGIEPGKFWPRIDMSSGDRSLARTCSGLACSLLSAMARSCLEEPPKNLDYTRAVALGYGVIEPPLIR